jgi:hypothetical protein
MLSDNFRYPLFEYTNRNPRDKKSESMLETVELILTTRLVIIRRKHS